MEEEYTFLLSIVVVCEAGEKRIGSNNTCMKCPLGYYQPERGQSDCIQCLTDQTTEQEGRINQADCIRTYIFVDCYSIWILWYLVSNIIFQIFGLKRFLCLIYYFYQILQMMSQKYSSEVFWSVLSVACLFVLNFSHFQSYLINKQKKARKIPQVVLKKVYLNLSLALMHGFSLVDRKGAWQGTIYDINEASKEVLLLSELNRSLKWRILISKLTGPFSNNLTNYM